MVSVSVRSLLVPGVAVVAAGAVALGPALVAPPAVTLAQPTVAVPSVHIEDIQLAGIGQDIYFAIQPWVAYGVELVQWATAWIPPVSSQIGILYFQGLQPLVEATVNALAGIVQNPFNIIGTLSAYGAALGVIGYNFVAAEASWFGIPLPPLPPIAATKGASAPLAAARTARAPRAAAADADQPAPKVATDLSTPAEAAAAVAVEARVPARVGRGQAARAARSAVVEAAQTARSAAAEAPAAAQQAAEEVSTAAQTAVTEIRNTARAPRVAKAVREARGAVRAAANAAN
jgi:hypothetical protein